MVWCTKYRKKVLEKDVGQRLRELCRQICSDMGVEILSGVVARDHVHVLVSILTFQHKNKLYPLSFVGLNAI